MNLLLSLSTLNPATNCQENWYIPMAREPEYTALTLGDFTDMGMSVEMQGETGESLILQDDTIELEILELKIVLGSADPSKTLDRYFGLLLRPASMNKSLSEIPSQIKNHRHESDQNNQESERLFVGLNPQQPSGGYRPKPKVPQ